MTDEKATFIDYLAALKKRRVFSTAALFIPSAWLAVEITEKVLQLSGGPDWALRLAIALAAGGFPVAMYLAWVFDITSDGIVRTGGVFRATAMVLVTSTVVLSVTTFGIYRWLEPDGPIVATGPCVPSAEDQGRYLASVGVLPFEYLSGDAQTANIAAGFAEEVRSMLSKVDSFCVPARVARDAIASARDNIKRIGDFLNVEYVLDGKVQMEGDDIRVNAQLVNTSTGLLEWSESYQGTKGSLFQMQDDISRGVVGSTIPAVLEDIEKLINDRPDYDTDAHYEYLLARHYFKQYGIDSISRAIELLEKAVQLEDRNPLMYAELVKNYVHNLQVLGEEEWGDRPQKALAAMERALQLNPDLAAVQTAYGKALGLQDRRIPDAVNAYMKATQLDPNYAEAWDWLAQNANIVRFWHCRVQKDPVAAEDLTPEQLAFVTSPPEILLDPKKLVTRAYRLDPYDPTIVASFASDYAESGEPDEAMLILNRSREFIRDSAVLESTAGRIMRAKGELVEAAQHAQRAVAIDHNPVRIMWLVSTLLMLEDAESAQEWIAAYVGAGGMPLVESHLRYLSALVTGDFQGYLDFLDADIPDDDLERGLAMLRLGREREGVELMRPYLNVDELNEWFMLDLATEQAWGYQQIGAIEVARELLEDIRRRRLYLAQCGAAQDSDTTQLAITLAMLGRREEAREAMRKVVKDGGNFLLLGQHRLGFDELLNDPETRELIEAKIRDLEAEKKRWQRLRSTVYQSPESI